MRAFYCDLLGATLKFRCLNQQGEMIGCYFAIGENTFVEVFDHADAHRRSRSSPLEETRESWLMRYNHFYFQVDGLDAFVAALPARGVSVTGRKTGNDRSLQAWMEI